MTEKQHKCSKCGHDLIYDYEIDNKDVFYCTECEKRVMALKGGKRYKRLVSSIDYYYCIDTNDDKGLTEEDMLNRLNEQDKLIRELRAEVEVHKHPLFSTRQAKEKIERYENDLRMCREKALYWRNKAEDIFGDMRTNVELKRDNEQLKDFIRKISTNNEIILANGTIYKIDKVIK